MKKFTFVLFLILMLGFSNKIAGQEPFLGEIKLVPYNFNPQGWAECNGQLLSIAQNSALFSLLGTQYGGDGETTFALPDLRGRVPIGQGQGPGLPNYSMGQQGGSTTNTLIANNLPQHSHPAFGVTEDGSESSPSGNYLANTKLLDGEYATAGTTAQMNAGMIGSNATSTQPVNNIQPYVTLRYIISLTGTFPSPGRNQD